MITPAMLSHIGRLVFGVGLLLVSTSNAVAQAGLVTTEENFRAEPNGVLLGQVRAGVSVEILTEAADWLQLELTGWVWTRSLQATSRRDLGLIVSASGGENLRGSPSGEVIGRLEERVLLEEIEQVPEWTHVRRVVWMWRPSVELFGERGAGAGTPSTGVTSSEDWARGGSAGTPILSSPDGDTLADIALTGTIFQQRLGGPTKHVDKSRRDHHTTCVHGDFGTRFAEVADQRDAVALDADIRFPNRSAGAVDHLSPSKYDVVLGLFGGAVGCSLKGQREAEQRGRNKYDYCNKSTKNHAISHFIQEVGGDTFSPA